MSSINEVSLFKYSFLCDLFKGRFAGREGYFPKECVRLVREIGVSFEIKQRLSSRPLTEVTDSNNISKEDNSNMSQICLESTLRFLGS